MGNLVLLKFNGLYPSLKKLREMFMRAPLVRIPPPCTEPGSYTTVTARKKVTKIGLVICFLITIGISSFLLLWLGYPTYKPYNLQTIL